MASKLSHLRAKSYVIEDGMTKAEAMAERRLRRWHHLGDGASSIVPGGAEALSQSQSAKT